MTSRTRRTFLKYSLTTLCGAIVSPFLTMRRAHAMGEDDALRVAWLMPGGGSPTTRTTGLRRLLQEVEKRTSVKVDASNHVVTFGEEMFDYPMLFLSGSGDFNPWSVEQVDQMRVWLKGGGFLVVDSHEGLVDGPFIRAAKRELARVYPDEKVMEVPGNHVLYKSFYIIKTPRGRVKTSETLDAYFEQDRLPVVFSPNDMLGAWARDGFGRWEYDMAGGAESQREYAIRMGVNLVLYALCVNYKDDQVHIPFILKRRTWKVE